MKSSSFAITMITKRKNKHYKVQKCKCIVYTKQYKWVHLPLQIIIQNKHYKVQNCTYIVHTKQYKWIIHNKKNYIINAHRGVQRCTMLNFRLSCFRQCRKPGIVKVQLRKPYPQITAPFCGFYFGDCLRPQHIVVRLYGLWVRAEIIGVSTCSPKP